MLHTASKFARAPFQSPREALIPLEDDLVVPGSGEGGAGTTGGSTAFVALLERYRAHDHCVEPGAVAVDVGRSLITDPGAEVAIDHHPGSGLWRTTWAGTGTAPVRGPLTGRVVVVGSTGRPPHRSAVPDPAVPVPADRPRRRRRRARSGVHSAAQRS